ncbi:MAG: response regulator transcription factor [Ornithinimicrobium sp.]|uniref:response regulator n=1 Tax=Ornithinimicrobium sp. TaxID=1977084 RepID=UPI0026DF15A9|nr:response regulator transcription factor [Ornithinimicrobium sp.]MDO5739605.1 response regulator transcription factor [Ornithinimicrobium sp.]
MPERQAPAPVRVYLLDDHELVRRGLHDLLSAEPDLEIVGESGSAVRAVAEIIALAPDVAVLDGRLPDGSGVEVCRDVRAANPSIRALILTSYDDDEALFASIMAGADGYVLKQIAGTDLVDGIRSIAAGRSLIDPTLVTKVMERLRHGDPATDKLALLTEQERRILDLIADGMTNRQIAQTLFLAEKTVKNYVTNVLAKLGLQRRTQAAVLGAKLFNK